MVSGHQPHPTSLLHPSFASCPTLSPASPSDPEITNGPPCRGQKGMLVGKPAWLPVPVPSGGDGEPQTVRGEGVRAEADGEGKGKRSVPLTSDISR